SLRRPTAIASTTPSGSAGETGTCPRCPSDTSAHAVPTSTTTVTAARKRIPAVSGRRVQRSQRQTTGRDVTSVTRASARMYCPAAIPPPSATSRHRLTAIHECGAGITRTAPRKVAIVATLRGAGVRKRACGSRALDELRLDLDGDGAADEYPAALEQLVPRE